jgi:hypothetical protein
MTAVLNKLLVCFAVGPDGSALHLLFRYLCMHASTRPNQRPIFWFLNVSACCAQLGTEGFRLTAARRRGTTTSISRAASPAARGCSTPRARSTSLGTAMCPTFTPLRSTAALYVMHAVIGKFINWRWNRAPNNGVCIRMKRWIVWCRYVDKPQKGASSWSFSLEGDYS